MEQLSLTNEWDKVFPKSDKVDHRKVTFVNRYGITLAADMYVPRGFSGPLPAVAVCGPFGAVKEQASGLYAQTLAERGFLTIAFDPSFTGESGGQPRYVASPDINTEDFCAAVDFLVTHPLVDPERVGILGICGWGGLSINAAAIEHACQGYRVMHHVTVERCVGPGLFRLTRCRRPSQLAPDAQRATHPGRAQRFVCSGRRGGGPSARGCASVCERLPCLLQDSARISQTFAQLQRRLERHVLAFVPQYAHSGLQ